MNTDTLFEFAVRGARAQAEVNELCQQPLSHINDPLTSYKAAEKMVKSGELNRQEKKVWVAINDYLYCFSKSNFTTKDIPKMMRYYSYDKAYDICRKRFSGLEMKNKIELIRIDFDKKTLKHIYKRRDGCRVWRLK